MLLAGGRDEVAALRSRDGSVAWKQAVHGRAYGLATANGLVFVSTDEGTIHCLRAARPQAGIAPQPPDPDGPDHPASTPRLGSVGATLATLEGSR